MDFQVILWVIISCFLATYNFIQVLLINLIQSSLQVIPQALENIRNDSFTKRKKRGGGREINLPPPKKKQIKPVQNSHSEYPTSVFKKSQIP